MFEYEKKYIDLGHTLIAGADEVGRGPLAGCVTVCAIIPSFTKIIDGVNDSKKLSDKKRRALYPYIIENAIAVNIATRSEKIIDEINILRATEQAFTEALNGLNPLPTVALLDAVKLRGLPCISESIIHGDALSYSVACASIVAKVTRDDYMRTAAELYPEYGFERNMGYGTAEHIAALKKYGPCPIHRRSFIKNFI
ncbi:MAG: ribonuclease HII [Christensenellaceae bacterium]|jgi:ribonuclease HII|nr:ribonuclease HII [Christensenellaceae bacterium]